MQNNDKMHPQDMRNLILFAALSIILWLSYDHFILKPKMEAMREAQETAKQAAITMQAQDGSMTADQDRPREEVIAETGRVTIESDAVFGSLNLKGALFDDLGLHGYYETVERKNNVIILSPSGTSHPKYIESGWVSEDSNLKLPNKDSIWRVVGGSKLTPSSPVTLEWSNGQGFTFQKNISLDGNYAFSLKQSVENSTGRDVTLYPYSLILRRGMPKEFLNRFVVHEGPMFFAGDELTEKTFGKMAKKPKFVETGEQGWAALTTKDWLTAIIPEQDKETKFRMTYTKGALENVKDRYQVDTLGPGQIVKTGSTISYETKLFAGAKKVNLIEEYEKKWDVPHLDLAVDFGMFYFLTRPFFTAINFFYGYVGNFGIAIILFTVCLRICVFPLANTSFRSFAHMRRIAPQMQELREKYEDDKQKMQQELVKLYQREKVNPMAGCLPILVQIPIFFSLFKVLSNTIEMRHAPFFGWVQDLSAQDPTTVFNLFGLIPWTPPGFLMIGAWPCLMLLTMIIQRKLSPPPTDKMQAQMIAWMPWIMTFVLSKFAVGLVIYWTFNNLFSTIQQYIIMRRLGVKVDLIGNIFGKKDAEEVSGTETSNETAKDNVVEMEAVQEEKSAESKPLTKPKPKRSKKKK